MGSLFSDRSRKDSYMGFEIQREKGSSLNFAWQGRELTRRGFLEGILEKGSREKGFSEGFLKTVFKEGVRTQLGESTTPCACTTATDARPPMPYQISEFDMWRLLRRTPDAEHYHWQRNLSK